MYNEKDTPTEVPSWLAGIGGTFFDLEKVSSHDLLVIKSDKFPSAVQMKALFAVTDTGLIMGRETEYDQRHAYTLYEGYAPLSTLADTVKDNWQAEIEQVLEMASNASTLPQEHLEKHLMHVNFPIDGVNPIRLSPAFIDAFQTIQHIGANTLGKG